MSSVTIIIAIIVLLASLVCYAFIAQTLVQKRQRRERLLGSLKTKARNFKFMLSAPPAGYLPKDLKLLVQRSLATVCEQLARLEPQVASHKEDLQAVTQQMTETQRQNDERQTRSLDNPQQTKEIKACLEELYKFVFSLEAKRSLTRAQADSYRHMIKQLLLEVTVDAYVLHGKIAKDKEKWRLAIHYFDLGLNLLLREGKNGQFDGRIAQLQQIIAGLKDLADSDSNTTAAAPGPTAASAEWDDFGQEPDWKKKQIYD